ncbi:predicted protein [Naegleria gruberi]|uniref:Predicted protein n=1 Tax=Naegleria gruberi TaxID=5762 RepID=D2VIN3_NAEGR|nr:uncharacterized protein NAEGRDRAFT_68738 [Naegleria gruberi]EFC43303.1 predicted protein [Naegleria gruberi]|eukprot:XP_002676047.1 predicted protein [Naegleria gruberi strain NEG-M]
MNFDTEFSLLFAELIQKMREIDCDIYKVDDTRQPNEGKIPIHQVDSTLMNISYKMRDENISNYQKMTFVASMANSNVELLFTFFQGGKPGSHPGYMSSNMMWSLFRDVLVGAKKSPSITDGGIMLFAMVSSMLSYSTDRFIYHFPEVLFDLILAPPRVIKSGTTTEFSKFALSDDIARMYEVENAIGLGNSIAQNIISWYQIALENKKEKATIFSCDVETFEMILKLTRDRIFIFVVENLKRCKNDRMMSGVFLDSFNDLMGTMRLNEREDFLLGINVERSFEESKGSSFSEEVEGRMSFLKHVFMSDQNTREEHVNFIIETFSNHPSKKIRDTITTVLGQHLVRKIKKRIQEKKLSELKASSLSHQTESNQEEYLLLICEFGGRKRKFILDNVHSVVDVQEYLTKAYTERKRNSEAISTKEDQEKIVSNSLQLFLPANQLKVEEGATPVGDWVDLDDFNVLQLSYRDINTKKVLSEKINQLKFVKKVTTKESTTKNSSLEGGSFVSNSFVPSTFEEDESALATKGSAGFTQAQQFSGEKTNSLLPSSSGASSLNSGKISALDSAYSAEVKPQGTSEMSGVEMSGIEISSIDGISVLEDSQPPQFSTIEGMSYVEGGANYFSSDDEQD